MPGQNLLGRCNAKHNAGVPIRTITIAAALAGSDVFTEVYAANPSLDPPYEGSTQVVTRTFDGSAEATFDRLDFVRGVTEEDATSATQFMLTSGCCCPCRWDLTTFGGSLNYLSDSALAADYTQVETIDGEEGSPTTGSFGLDPLLQFATAGAKCRPGKAGAGQMLLAVSDPATPEVVFEGGTYERVVTITGATRQSEGETGWPVGGLLAEFDSCVTGEYVVAIAQTVSASKTFHDEDLDVDVTRTYTHTTTTTYTITLG